MVCAVLASYIVRIRSGMADFAVNYLAGRRLEAGVTLYQTADGHYMFKYLPISALIYLPLGHLPIEWAKATWFAISLIALGWSCALVSGLVPRPHRRWLMAIAGLVLAKYFLHELRLGQINILVTLIMLLAVRALSTSGSNHEIAAGALVGAATALKPYAALFVPYLVIKRKWTAVGSAVGVLVVALLVPAAFYGWSANVHVLGQWAATLSQSTPALLTNNDNVSVPAFFAKWAGQSVRALAATVVVFSVLSLVMLVVIVRGGGRRHGAVLEGAMLLTLVPLVSPLGWDYTFLMSLLAVALLVNALNVFPPTARIALTVNFAIVALAVFDLMGRRAYAIFMQWSVTTLNFLVVVFALAYLRLRTDL